MLSEIDFETSRPTSNPITIGGATWSKLDYEVFQGLHYYLTYQLGNPDYSSNSARSSALGIGSRLFSRPHFEFDFLWQFQNSPAFPAQVLDYVTLLMHFYL